MWPTSFRQVPGHALDSLQVSRPHVLAGINTESFNPDVDHIVEIRRDLLPHVLLPAVQVVEADQVAVADLIRVAVVLNLAVGLVEVQAAVGDSLIILTSSVEARSSGALARAAPPCHVVDHCVNDDPEHQSEGHQHQEERGQSYLHHPHSVTGVDHVDELLPVARPRGVQLVGDWLVSGPPLASLGDIITVI